jgi:hypothetical protein
MRRLLTGWVRWVPWAMLGASAALGAAAVVVGLAGGADLVAVFSIAVLGLVFGVTGALIASRLPENLIGWLFCAISLLSFEASGLADAYAAYDGNGELLPGQAWVAWAAEWLINSTSPALIFLCFLLFPTGRLPSARWRPLVWAVVAAAAVHAASTALVPGALSDYPFENPVGVEAAPWLRTLSGASLRVLVVPLMLLSVASLFVRLRRASGTERQQLKWFAYAAALLAIDLVAGNVLGAFFGGSLGDDLFFVFFLIAISAMPVAMGIAILRYRLYDIDLLINRTLVYGTVTIALLLVYVGVVVSSQYAFRALTGQGSQLAVVASTLAIASLFSPLRRRIQGFIDRRFYRRKYDARKTLEGFGARLRDETDLDRLGEDLVGVVRETVQPSYASLWLRTSPGRGAEERETGT